MQTTHQTAFRRLAYFLTGLMSLAITPVQASYTVIDDDLLPTSVVEARTAPVSQHYTIPFGKSSSPLNQSGRDILDMLLPKMQGASIRIVGRPDAMVFTAGKMGAIPRNRAINIRDHLTRRGIPANKIEIAVDNTPNEQTQGSSYPSDIYIVRADGRSQPNYQAQAPQSPDYAYRTPELIIQAAPQRVAPNADYPTARQQAPMQNMANNQLLEYINYVVQSGRMQPSVALVLLRSLMESDSSFASQQTPAPVPVPAQIALPAAVPIHKGMWTLDKAMTLRENVDAWLKTSGWSPSVWEASGIYEITTTATLQGGFPDVLRQIAESTGLNICVKNREKHVRVTDSTVACK